MNESWMGWVDRVQWIEREASWNMLTAINRTWINYYYYYLGIRLFWSSHSVTLFESRSAPLGLLETVAKKNRIALSRLASKSILRRMWQKVAGPSSMSKTFSNQITFFSTQTNSIIYLIYLALEAGPEIASTHFASDNTRWLETTWKNVKSPERKFVRYARICKESMVGIASFTEKAVLVNTVSELESDQMGNNGTYAICREIRRQKECRAKYILVFLRLVPWFC